MSDIQVFAKKVAPHIYKAAKDRNFPEYICGIIIAQAYYESDSNGSELSKDYFNFFNIKASSSYKGNKVTIDKTTYRKYSSIKEGIEGYFDFISSPRYSNIKKATSGKDYLEKLKADGYSIKSFNDVYKIYKDNKLADYNYEEDIVKPVQPKVTPKPVYTVPKKTPVNTTPEYFPKYSGQSSSIITALLSLGCKDTSSEYRKSLAQLNNIAITADFNIKLFDLLKQGKLRKK